jgi:hypothetical protein
MGVLRSRGGDVDVVLSAVHVVGRMQSCNLPLTSSFVSTAHAMIRWDGGAWSVRDLGSRNGTYVNDTVIPKGEPIVLRRGARIAFGAPAEAWELINDRRPEAAVISLDGGDPIFLTGAVNGIPTREEPLATVYLDKDRWLLEHEESRVALQAGALFVVAGRAFRFDCPSDACATAAAREREWSLDSSTLVLGVSRDEEHVSLTIQASDRAQELGERACFYLMLVLARARLRATSEDGTGGWVPIDTLLRMVPEYSSGTHLNVEIFRLRRLLANAGVRDAAQIIERRRGQVRLGSDRIEIRRVVADVV